MVWETSRIQVALLTAIVSLAAAGPALAQTAPKGAAPQKKGAPAAKAPRPGLLDSLTGLAKAELLAAKTLYEVGDFANAIIKFRKAYELSKEPRLLYNIAACEKDLLHYTKALAAIEQYQVEDAENLTDDDRARAKLIIEALKPLISTVKILVSEPGADIFIDNEKVGTSPLAATVPVNVGDRTLRVEKPGYKKSVTAHQLQGGTEVTLVVKLEKEVHRGQVVIHAGPKDLISIDGKMVAQGRWEGPLASGGHTLRVTGIGMVPYQSEVVVQDNKTRRIDVTLHPKTKSDTATWVWLASGAAVLAGAAVGGAFLFRPTYTPPVDGTIITLDNRQLGGVR